MAGDVTTPYGYFPGNYRSARLADICVPNGGVQTGPFGSQLHQRDYVSIGTPIITVEHLGENRIIHSDLPRVTDDDKDRLKRYTLQKGDIVFSRVGSVDLRALVREKEDGWLFSGRLLRVRPNNGVIDSEYLSWFFGLSSFREYVRKIAFGATMPSLNTKLLSDLPIYFPPLPKQRAIAHILGTLEDKIELNRKMNLTLEAMAQALFKSWFVDFDPVKAKVAGKKTGLPKDMDKLFPSTFQDSELGKIPKEWRVMPLSDICNTQYGYTASSSDESVGPKLLRVTDINKANWIDWSTVPYCRIDETNKSKYSLNLGDIVVARMADPGKSAIIDDNINAVFASYLVRLKTSSLALSYFVYGYLKSQYYAEYATGAMSGSVQSNMNAKVIVGSKIVVPPDETLIKFSEQVVTLRRGIANNVQQSTNVAAIRDTLLPKLINGTIQVKYI